MGSKGIQHTNNQLTWRDEADLGHDLQSGVGQTDPAHVAGRVVRVSFRDGRTPEEQRAGLCCHLLGATLKQEVSGGQQSILLYVKPGLRAPRHVVVRPTGNRGE